jgi:hypothetical protein
MTDQDIRSKIKFIHGNNVLELTQEEFDEIRTLECLKNGTIYGIKPTIKNKIGTENRC